MNIQEFLNYNKYCPLCDGGMSISLHRRKGLVRYQDDNIVFVYTMKALRSNLPDYKVGYSFKLNDNSFCVEFDTEWDQSKQTQLYLIRKFKEFHANLGNKFAFNRYCTQCSRYCVRSNSFDLNFKSCVIPDLQIEYEHFGFVENAEDKYKITVLCNILYDNEADNHSKLYWWRAATDAGARYDHPPGNDCSRTVLPIVPFVSKEETNKRLNNLITFA